MKSFEFFLGGDDAEMREIKSMLDKHGYKYHCKGLQWGEECKASSYEGELLTYGPKWYGDEHPNYIGGADHRPIPVLIELEVDCETPSSSVVVDHHGERAGEMPALQQVCKLIGVTPTRRQDLIGVVDAGYVHGLEAIGASKEEIRVFLGASENSDTLGQMIQETEKHPKEIIYEAERAIREAETVGDLVIARCNHNTTSPITSRLYDQQERQNVLVLSTWTEGGKEKTEANFFGNGEEVRKVNEIIKGGWTGGAGLMPHTPEAKKFWTQYGGTAPDTAYWGTSGEKHGTVLKAVLSVTK